MKTKLLIPALLLTALLAGCDLNGGGNSSSKNSNSNTSSSGSEADAYKISKAVYEKKFKMHDVMFESNYSMICKEGDTIRNTCDFDSGKIKSIFTNGWNYIFYVRDGQEDVILSQWYSSNGTDYNAWAIDQHVTYDYVYDMFFGSYKCFFNIPYESLKYNSEKKGYEAENITATLGESSKDLKYLFIQAKNNQPLKMQFVDSEDKETSYDFYNHGAANVVLPE